MAEKKKYEFENLNQIEAFEMLNPGIFYTDAQAVAAAHECLERRLEHWHRMLGLTLRAPEGSVFNEQSKECKANIMAINGWLKEHPLLKTAEATDSRKVSCRAWSS